jgi:hypothetical protein
MMWAQDRLAFTNYASRLMIVKYGLERKCRFEMKTPEIETFSFLFGVLTNRSADCGTNGIKQAQKTPQSDSLCGIS